LDQHELVHMDRNGQEKICQVDGCKKSFLYFSSLKTHIKGKHPQEYEEMFQYEKTWKSSDSSIQEVRQNIKPKPTIRLIPCKEKII